MWIRKWVEVEKEVEVNIDQDDIRVVLDESQDDLTKLVICRAVCDFHEIMKAVTDEHLELLSNHDIVKVEDFFREQAERFKRQRQKMENASPLLAGDKPLKT